MPIPPSRLTTTGPVSVDGNGAIEGTLRPDETVEAVNLSTAPTTAARVTDGIEIAKTDAWGRFKGSLAGAQQGDVVRLQTRNPEGRVTSWLNVRVQQAGGTDARAAFVNLARLVVTARPDGLVDVAHAGRLPLTEPGAVIRFTNTRTGEFSDVTADENGHIPSLRLNGQAGDSVSVAVSDGGGNTDFSFIAGTLSVVTPLGADLSEPAPLAKDGQPGVMRSGAALFPGPVSVDDVKQGQIGNCYVPAACAAVAHADHDAIKDLVRDDGDGAYTVTFQPPDGPAVQVRVDGDLYGYGNRPRYGQGALWFSLVEKALAVWRGSYEQVGKGGSVGRMMSELLGRPNTEHWLSGGDVDSVFSTIMQATRDGRAMAAGTYGSAESARYTNSGVYANHAYSVLGAVEENGQKLVILRNPWGSGEAGYDGRDDGIFKLPVEKFLTLYQVLNVC